MNGSTFPKWVDWFTQVMMKLYDFFEIGEELEKIKKTHKRWVPKDVGKNLPGKG